MGLENDIPMRLRAPLVTSRGVASGTELQVGGLASASLAASTAITGTTETRTVFSASYTIPANTLLAGTRVRVAAVVFHTATTGAETHTLAVALGATDIMTSGNIDPANDGVTIVEAEFVVRSQGATGTVVGWGLLETGTRGGSPAAQVLYTGTGATTTVAIDTTAALVLGIAIDRQGTATDSDSCRLDYLTVDIVGP